MLGEKKKRLGWNDRGREGRLGKEREREVGEGRKERRVKKSIGCNGTAEDGVRAGTLSHQ